MVSLLVWKNVWLNSENLKYFVWLDIRHKEYESDFLWWKTTLGLVGSRTSNDSRWVTLFPKFFIIESLSNFHAFLNVSQQ